MKFINWLKRWWFRGPTRIKTYQHNDVVVTFETRFQGLEVGGDPIDPRSKVGMAVLTKFTEDRKVHGIAFRDDEAALVHAILTEEP